MKVTVCINDTKIVVPCGDGDLSVRQLAELAIIRYRKTVLAKTNTSEFVEINSLKLARDGGILDWDDKVHDVLDDRDLLIAQNSSICSVTPSQPSTLSTPPLLHHSVKTTVSTCDVFNCNVSTSNLGSVINQQSSLALTQIVPTIFSSVSNHEHRFTSRHNSIPCSDQDSFKRLDFEGNHVVTARHESLDDILDANHPNKMLIYTNSLSKDYERWPLPPFPMGSTLQSSTEMTVIPKYISSNLQDSDDQTWDNSPNDCDEEDYPRLRPDYIVKHFQNSPNKSISGGAPSRQVLQWLESQDCGSQSSSGGGGGVGPLLYDVSSDIKESESNHVSTDVLEDRNNNRIHASSSSVSSGNDHNRLKEDISSSLDDIAMRLLENSIIVRLINPKAGENLGIQITPAYLQGNIIDQNCLNKLSEAEQKSIYGIEVHSIMPKGRVAKERQLNKGDKIIQINGTNLIGMAYEKGEALFRDALTKIECKLRVIPFQYPSILSAPIQINKGNPPPPPKRSPNTALSKGKPTVASSSGSSEKGILISTPQQPSKSPIPFGVLKSNNPKLIPALVPPHQQNPVASWTSGFGSMVHTPASSTSSVSALEKKKLNKITDNELPKTELIELTKIGSGFGFSITGKDNLPPTIPSAVYVRHILPDGAAIRDGRLKSGDRLLEVDGLLLDGMSQSEVIALLREKPSGSRVKLLVERNPTKLNSQCSASHDSLMTSVSEMDEEGSTLSKNKRNTIKLHFDIPLHDCNHPTTLGISVKVEPNWDKSNITQFSSKEDIAASNIVWVKTVIENGAAYRHGKLMVGDQLMEINSQSLSGLSSDEALMKLKNIIKEAQESEDGMVHVAVQRKLNMARSSSLNTLNSMTGSGSANSFMPFYEAGRNIMTNKLPGDHQAKNIPLSVNPNDAVDSEFVPNSRPALDLPNSNAAKLPVKSTKRSAPVPPFSDSSQPVACVLDKTPKSKPAPPPPPPPLARRLKKCFKYVSDWNINSELDPSSFQTFLSSTFSTSADFISTTSGLACNAVVATSMSDYFTANSSFKKPQSNNRFDDNSKINDIPFSLESNSTTNTLCRNKDSGQLILRARNTRSNCSYTPTKDILHIDDIDWDKMELIPFANCDLASRFNNAAKINSSSQPAINQTSQTKKFHDTGSGKRRGFKKFSISQLFKSRHNNYPKPANSAGSSPIALRKQSDNTNNKSSSDNENQLPITRSSHSIKSNEQTIETEYPYAELDFGSSPYSITTNKNSLLLSPAVNAKTNNATVSNLLPLPEESFSFFSNRSSDDSDSYEDFEDVESVIPGHISAVQRIAAAMPKQPPNRFVYEDAEELFQSLQANVSYGQESFSDKKPSVPISTFKFQPFDKNDKTTTKEVYQNVFNMSGLSIDTPIMPSCINSSNGFGPSNSSSFQSKPSQSRNVVYNTNQKPPIGSSFSDSRQQTYLNVQSSSIPK